MQPDLSPILACRSCVYPEHSSASRKISSESRLFDIPNTDNRQNLSRLTLWSLGVKARGCPQIKSPGRSLESICLLRSHSQDDRINLRSPSIFLSSNLRWNIIIKIYSPHNTQLAWRGEIYTFPRYNWAYQTHLVVTLYVMYHRLREWRREKRELFLRSQKMGFRLWASSPFNPFSYFMNHHKKLPSQWISTHPCYSERLHFSSCWNQSVRVVSCGLKVTT